MNSERNYSPDSVFNCRSAIEGLRTGVPNRWSVAALGCGQPRIVQEFEAQIARVQAGQSAKGLMIRGDFGMGKSHTLQYLGEMALNHGFVCSRLYVSKEAPLFDPVRLFSSAADSAALPDRAGNAFVELANNLVFHSPAFRDFERWTNQPARRKDSPFASTLLLFEKFASDHELRDQIIRFWAGDKLPVSNIRKRLRQINESYPAGHLNARELAIERFRFASRLIRAAGYAGWLLLIDEVELIGSYSVLQRAKSYIEIARLMNVAEDSGYGAWPVLAITEDYGRAVLQDKCDLEKIPGMLAQRALHSGDPDSEDAKAGMRILNTGGLSLKRPDENVLDETYETIRGLYSRAYRWEAPVLDTVIRGHSTPLRSYIRAWITEWDLSRLYGEHITGIETESYRNTYTEDDSDPGADERQSDASIVDELTNL
ncbi:MAG: BREX system ATP-binding domain-containing protein [Bryobacteraceae bacterium]|nr:BREX system ATP-binding domain-containing protein [Bryobacteraceae bacterium]